MNFNPNPASFVLKTKSNLMSRYAILARYASKYQYAEHKLTSLLISELADSSQNPDLAKFLKIKTTVRFLNDVLSIIKGTSIKH